MEMRFLPLLISMVMADINSDDSRDSKPCDKIAKYDFNYQIMSLEWWQKNVMYNLYLPSFKDSNNDGIGDFQGLTSSLHHFDELSIKTLLLSPFYLSPKSDNGYDISSYVDIDPIYGNLEDFGKFMKEIKKREMNVIVDLVPNHTSHQHPWFQLSVQREEPYTDFYVWVDPKPGSNEEERIPPNNWLSVFGGSAWTWNEQRKQFYFHQFLPEQPDLNLRNPAVIEELKKVMAFWLEKGVDGFRIDAASHLFEDEQLRDEPKSEKNTAKKDEYGYLKHIYTKGLPENLNCIKELRKVVDEYAEKTGKAKILVAEAVEEINEVMRYYGDVGDKVADFPFNFQLYKVKATDTGTALLKKIDMWLKNMPRGKYPNWVLSSHDDRRVTRLGFRLAFALHMIIMLMPGIPFCYYGDEIGMQNAKLKDEDIRDSFALRTSKKNSRDPMRTPMQWNSGKHAGFTNGDKTWLPVNENYKEINVEIQRDDPMSFLNLYKCLVPLRNEPSILVGILVFPLVNENVFSVLRFLVDTKCYLLLLNMSSKCINIDMRGTSEYLPNEAFLELSNGHFDNTGDEFNESVITSSECTCQNQELSLIQDGPSSSVGNRRVKVALNNVHLKCKEAVILSFIGAKQT